MKLETRGRFTDLVPGWRTSSSVREAQIARLESYLLAARHELAGVPAQLALFRRPRLDASTEEAQRWLDSILLPVEPKQLSFVVSVVSIGSYDGPVRGIWRGFYREWLGQALSIEAADCSAAKTCIHPANLVSVEVLEVVWEREDEDDWYDW